MSRHASKHPKPWKQALAAGAGGMLVIGLLAGTRSTVLPLLMGSFGSSAVLVFGFPESGFCKPLRVIGAHVLCTAIGLACLHLFGEHAWSLGLSVGLSITLMLGLRLVHPPAGSNPLLVYALHPGWSFLLWPALLGSTALVLGAALWRRFTGSPSLSGGLASQPAQTHPALMSTPRVLSLAEQLQVLHSGADVATFALKHLGLPEAWRDTNEPGNTERCQEAVNRVFTLTRADIEAELASKGVQPEQLPFIHTTADSRDGWYLLKQNGAWEFSWQERGYPNFLVTFDDLAEARKLVLNHFIPVWLRHLQVSCRTQTGESITRL